MVSDWMIEVNNPHEIRNPKKRKNRGIVSGHREGKTVAHTTVNGVGIVGRLRKKKQVPATR